MLRVIQSQAVAADKSTLEPHKNAVEDRVSNQGYNLPRKKIDIKTAGLQTDDKSLRLRLEFYDLAENEDFWNWYKNYLSNNSSDFISAQMRNHDCPHMGSWNGDLYQGTAVTIQGYIDDSLDVQARRSDIKDYVDSNLPSSSQYRLSSGTIDGQKTMGISIRFTDSSEKSDFKHWILNYVQNYEDKISDQRMIDHELDDRNHICFIGDKWVL